MARTTRKKGGAIPEMNRLNSRLAVSYVRVSSREQSEGFSISAQKNLLDDYAHRHGLEIVHVFEEAETAKKAGRKQFDLMLEWVEKHPEVGNILVEKTDRLYRNLTDYTRLDVEGLRIRVHLVKDADILEPDSRSQSKFMHGIRVLMAKNYIDNLSEEVRKGQMEKARQGIWPSSAPIGYKNNSEGRNIIPHPQQGMLIRKGFELAATGQYSLSRLKRELHKMGLRSRRAGNELGKEAMARVLRNPIYHGDFVWSGQIFKGIHEPLISKQLFARAQEAMGFVQKPRLTKHSFKYVGLLKCGHCGCAITAERQKKKSGRTYIYYHCTNGKGSCTNVTFIREESLESSFANALRAIKISPDILE